MMDMRVPNKMRTLVKEKQEYDSMVMIQKLLNQWLDGRSST